jgi:hypothetical protein
MEKRIEEFHKGIIGGTEGYQRGGVRVASTTIQPFAGSNPSRHSILDALSKLSGIKQRSRQIVAANAGLLWIDFENPSMQMIVTEDDALPVKSNSTGGLFSGMLWSAFYGLNGMPVLANYPETPALRMEHDGFFAQHIDVSAVIISLPRHSVLFENPNSTRPLPGWFRHQCFNLRWFAAGHSICETSIGQVRSLIEAQRAYLRDLSVAPIIPFW